MLLLEQGRAPDQAVGAPQPNSSQDPALQSSQRWSSGKRVGAIWSGSATSLEEVPHQLHLTLLKLLICFL